MKRHTLIFKGSVGQQFGKTSHRLAAGKPNAGAYDLTTP